MVTGPLGNQADGSQDPAGFGHSCRAQKRDTLSLKARVVALCEKQNLLRSNGDSSSRPLPLPVASMSPFFFGKHLL